MINHLDQSSQMRALPLIEDAQVAAIADSLSFVLRKSSGFIQTAHGQIQVDLYSDSDHLHRFFVSNWGGKLLAATDPNQELRIVAVRELEQSKYPNMRSEYRYIDPNRKTILTLGNEYYGNVKISVRGLCSVAAMDFESGSFVHGAAISIRNSGLVLAGSSGAGKTTMTRKVAERFGDFFSVINDDWGWVDPSEKRILFTGEPHLHMKYRSVKTLAPSKEVSPEQYLSENYYGDPTNPSARLLIPRNDVFERTADQADLLGIFFVTSEPGIQEIIWPVDNKDLARIEASQYSAFYDRHEMFMDGSLLLTTSEHIEIERQRFKKMIKSIPAFMVNNHGDPTLIGSKLCDKIESLF